MSSSSGRRKAKPKEVKKKGVAKEVEEEVKKVEKEVVKEAKKVEKAVERRAGPKVQHPRPSARIPLAMVTARHGTGTITRAGRGFSLGELSGGGLTRPLAARWGVKVDQKRRSVLEGNVAALKTWHSSGAEAAVEREAKAAEEEVKGAGEEVEREVVAAAEEVVKAEKAVRKEAKKAGKAVKKKVEKRKARPKKKKS
ncbi:MAG: ribosomal protein L13e [Nitrososphaerota archaeon]|nr:ribosomal protein L13e [Nitrososphaerota archaeon]MDG7024453.1 ribosomal protein L13e [Nitrososphaerota archaeon]